MTKRTFWQSFLAAAIGGAASGAVHAGTSGLSLEGTGISAGMGALIGVVGLLVQSPIAKQQAPAAVADPAPAQAAPAR